VWQTLLQGVCQWEHAYILFLPTGKKMEKNTSVARDSIAARRAMIFRLFITIGFKVCVGTMILWLNAGL